MSIDLSTISAATDKEKYSRNFWRWMKKNKAHHATVMFSRWNLIDGALDIERDESKTQMGNIIILPYISYSKEQSVTGTKLVQILTHGAKATVWAYPPNKEEYQPLDSWMDSYIKHGKCWLDPEHSFYDERWNVQGNHRECKWCGFE